MKVIRPFIDGEQLWLGDKPGTFRKVFKCMDNTNTNNFSLGITVFEPGEGNITHNHPISEEVDYVISGSGITFDSQGNIIHRFKKGDILFYKEGEFHRHFNDGEETLQLLCFYSPHSELPSR